MMAHHFGIRFYTRTSQRVTKEACRLSQQGNGGRKRSSGCTMVLAVYIPEDLVTELQLNDPEVIETKSVLTRGDKTHPRFQAINDNYQMIGSRVYAITKNGLRFCTKADAVSGNISGLLRIRTSCIQACPTYLEREYWFPKMRSAEQKFVQFWIPCDQRKRGTDEDRL